MGAGAGARLACFGVSGILEICSFVHLLLLDAAKVCLPRAADSAERDLFYRFVYFHCCKWNGR